MRTDHAGAAHWIEIEAPALRHNLGLFRSILSLGTRLAAVVKANAYGHGMGCVVPAIVGHADWLAVHTAEEARQIRRLGISLPVLIMGYLPRAEMYDLDRDIHVLVSTEEVLGWLGEYRQHSGIALPVHVKVETGTHRQGVSLAQLPAVCRAATAVGLEIVGVATHFANIEDTLDHSFALHQLELFHRAVSVVRKQIGSDPPFVHSACSAAALLFRKTDFSLVRVGISLYGHWPSRETQLSWILEHGHNDLKLVPALTWKAVVGQIQKVKRGETVGYGRSWKALRATRLAVVPVGYADGYPRALGNRARALVHGVAVPVVGRVCMNILMLDVTDIPGVRVGDEVVLIGRDGEASVTAEELAGHADTINYELLARLSPATPRVLVGS